MWDLGDFRLIAYFFSLLGVIALASTAGDKSHSKTRAFYIKKAAWAILIPVSFYWVISIPYVGFYHEHPKTPDYPTSISADEADRYIKENHSRIEGLQNELKETKEALREIQQHYYMILQIIMYGIIFYGGSQIFNSKNKSAEEIQSDQIEKL
jgi:amino acid transporter